MGLYDACNYCNHTIVITIIWKISKRWVVDFRFHLKTMKREKNIWDTLTLLVSPTLSAHASAIVGSGMYGYLRTISYASSHVWTYKSKWMDISISAISSLAPRAVPCPRRRSHHWPSDPLAACTLARASWRLRLLRAMAQCMCCPPDISPKQEGWPAGRASRSGSGHCKSETAGTGRDKYPNLWSPLLAHPNITERQHYDKNYIKYQASN